MTRMPARRDGLLARSIGSETVVYDDGVALAHALSPLATSVFAQCDGRRTVAEAALVLEVPVTDVETALTTLTSLGLVESAGISRRSVITKAGLVGAGALAVTVAAPLAAAHATSTGMTGPSSQTFGGALTPRANLDSYASYATLDVSDVAPATATTITSFNYYAQAAGTIYLVVADSSGMVTYVGPDITVPAGQGSTAVPGVTLPAAGFIGFGITGSSVIPFDFTGGSIDYADDGTGRPAVGAAFPTQGVSGRTYSFNVTIV